jgi:hypothetical protein
VSWWLVSSTNPVIAAGCRWWALSPPMPSMPASKSVVSSPARGYTVPTLFRWVIAARTWASVKIRPLRWVQARTLSGASSIAFS